MSSFFFFNDTATTEIYTLSLHDALPIFTLPTSATWRGSWEVSRWFSTARPRRRSRRTVRSEEHTSELQSRLHLVCRLLLEKKKKLSAKIRDRISHRSAVMSALMACEIAS